MGEEDIRRRWGLALKTVISVVLLALVLQGIDWTVFHDHLIGLEGGSVVLALASFVLVGAFEIARMGVVLAAFRLSWKELVRLHVVGFFFGSFLPGQVGSDLYKIHFLGRKDQSLDRGLALVLLVRLSGFLLVFGAAMVGLAEHGQELRTQLAPRGLDLRVAPAAVVALVVVLVFATRTRSRDRLRVFFDSSRRALGGLGRRQVLALVALSMLVLAARVLVLDRLVAATGTVLPASDALFVVALATLITMIPISFAGIGLREGVVTALLVFFLVPYEEAFLVAALWRAFMVSVALAGGLWLLREKI